MNVIVCVDDCLGMLFNKRRQSRDSILIKKVFEISRASRLLAGEFSRAMLEEFSEKTLIIDNDFLSVAEKGDFCFVENCSLTPFIEKLESVIVFRWNRRYPADFFLDLDLTKLSLVSSCEFEGSSHEKITMEVYKK